MIADGGVDTSSPNNNRDTPPSSRRTRGEVERVKERKKERKGMEVGAVYLGVEGGPRVGVAERGGELPEVCRRRPESGGGRLEKHRTVRCDAPTPHPSPLFSPLLFRSRVSDLGR
ncbi:hypothetical protein BHE74_00028083 [Ensete ventricosum]|nr:hypothetical protein GW17_00034392 [Ensete ventricosum]RWW64661.1 hypothetical protein BHE74_00028083 [Ensete ventricosum]RZS26014.1 hypothetical protein BHM03_00059305 [Ensete ventricosum]